MTVRRAVGMGLPMWLFYGIFNGVFSALGVAIAYFGVYPAAPAANATIASLGLGYTYLSVCFLIDLIRAAQSVCSDDMAMAMARIDHANLIILSVSNYDVTLLVSYTTTPRSRRVRDQARTLLDEREPRRRTRRGARRGALLSTYPFAAHARSYARFACGDRCPTSSATR
jgi:hypothetical protein